MGEYSDAALFGASTSARPATVGAIDDDPDKAQRAMDLAKVTGAPATAVFNDLDDFERRQKATMASDIVGNNPAMSDWVRADPMHPKLANDSYGAMDSVSQKHSALTKWLDSTSISDAFMKGFGDAPAITRADADPDVMQHPFMSALGATGATMVELPLRTLSGVFSAVGHTLVDPFIGEGNVDKSLSVLMDPGTQATLQGMGPPGMLAAAGLGALAKVHPAALTWMAHERPPPVGVWPELDKARADLNAEGVDKLKEVIQENQTNPLQERNPEAMNDFLKNYHEARSPAIDGEAVVRLYGDKVPTPGDGLLGDVPDIAGQFELAKTTGEDVRVPLADWITKVDPEVFKALEEDIRMQPDGITKNEVKLEAERKEAEAAALPEGESPKPAEPLPEALPTFRAASALEPLLSVGDRKLELYKVKNDDPRYGEAAGFHDFMIQDEKNNTVGSLSLSMQKDGKQLYVDSIEGVNGLGPRDFGPALMRDLLRQIKEQFPDAETITGHRVSGARDKAGSYMAPSAMPVIKLDNPKGWSTADHADWVRVLEGGQWEKFSPTLEAYIKPKAERSVADRELINAVTEELDRIAPQKLGVQEADRIKTSGGQGQLRGDTITPTGTYIAYKDAYPLLLYSLEGPDPIGTARHEAIHHLYRYGFFKPEEWTALARASRENGWAEQFGIDRRYPTASEELRVEESIADAYKHWEAGRIGEVSPEVEGIFARMKQFFDNLRKRIGELLGKDPTWEDIFEKVSTGEVGGREGTEPLVKGAYNEKLSVPEGDARDYQRANTYGLPVEAFRQYDKRLQEQYANDLAQAEKRAMQTEGRKQTAAWKEERSALRKDVAENIRNRPDVAADLFLGAGELYGKKVPLADVRLDASKLNDVQKAMLPRNYYGAKGLDPDTVANMFGYGSGDAMVERLGAYNVPKLLTKMSARDFVSKAIDMETDRQMQLRHGVLANNIMDAAKEQALGDADLNRVHEETVFLGAKIGQEAPTRAVMAQQVRELFKQAPLSSVNAFKSVAKLGSMGREIEGLMRTGKWNEAFQLAQKREFAMTVAGEMVKVEKDVAKFDATTKRLAQRVVPSIEQEYINFIHDIMVRVGKPVRRSVQDIATEIAAGEHKDLPSFVEAKESFGLREVAVADLLMDPGFRKDMKDLTVDEFQAVKTSIDSLIANGRDEKKINKAGADADFQTVKGQMIDSLKEFGLKHYDAKGGRWMGPVPPVIAHALRSYGTAHIQMETLLNRWDHGDPHGVFQQYIMRDLADAATSEVLTRTEFAKKLRALDDKADLKKLVDNPLFRDPDTKELMQLNRGNLRAILLNLGNKSNAEGLARGYGLKSEVVMAWAQKHALPEDWAWAQGVGKLFDELKGRADDMYRKLSGVAPEDLPIEPFSVQHPSVIDEHGAPLAQTLEGWYYPKIAHAEFEAKPAKSKDALEQQNYVRATTPSGYTKKRTGATYPLALDLDMMPNRLGQMIHDIEMRPAVINAAKVFYDKDFRSAVRAHFGAEWRDMLEPYLVDVANSGNYVPRDQRAMVKASKFFQQNIVSTLVGLNPGTVLKHAPTAAVQSLHEVGMEPFLKELKGLFSVDERTGETNWQFAMKNFAELQVRHQNYMETLGGAADELQPNTGYAKLRATIQSVGAYPVAMSDLLSAVPTALAEYRKAIDAGATEGDAIYAGNRAVRRAHGSVIITNRSKVMRLGPLASWMSQVYGFFNHIMNRQYELLWQAGERVDEIKSGEKPLAMKDATKFTGMLFAYVVAPALIEEMVSPLASTDGESWGKKAAKGLAFTLGASWVGVRDIANHILNGRDPSIGLLDTEAKTLTDFVRDLNKEGPFSKQHAGKIIRDGASLMGGLSGVVPAQVGRAAQFGTDVATGQERPKGLWGWMVGSRYGTLAHHSTTFDEWLKHH